jgi:hypothetical protein
MFWVLEADLPEWDELCQCFYVWGLRRIYLLLLKITSRFRVTLLCGEEVSVRVSEWGSEWLGCLFIHSLLLAVHFTSLE